MVTLPLTVTSLMRGDQPDLKSSSSTWEEKLLWQRDVDTKLPSNKHYVLLKGGGGPCMQYCPCEASEQKLGI